MCGGDEILIHTEGGVEAEEEEKNGKSSMAEQNGRTKTTAAVVTGVGGSEFVEGWTLAQTLGEGAYGE